MFLEFVRELCIIAYMDNQMNFKRGKSVKVFQKIIEGKKERIISFEGKITKSRGSNGNRMLTVRQYIDGVDVDRIFPLNAPAIIKVEPIEDKKKARKIAARQAIKSTKKTTKKA